MGQELQRQVLLIDACPSRPEISELLACKDRSGWTDLLLDSDQPLQSLALPTSSEYVSFLPAGRGSDGPASPEGLQSRLTTAQQDYDFVILFGGSVLGESAHLALLPHVGCVLLMIEENETLATDLKAAQQALALCKARNVRLVLASALADRPRMRNGRSTRQELARSVSAFVPSKNP